MVVLPSRELAFLETVRTMVAEHLGDTQFGVERLAEDLSMSRRQLSRKLRALVEETPVAMIRRMRLEQAVALLNEGVLSVKEIAFGVGFRDESYFGRLFRETYGVPPSEYTQQAHPRSQ